MLYIHSSCGSTSFSHQNVYLNTVFPSVIQLQLPPLVSLLCTSPPPPSLSTGHLQLPHPQDTISLTLLEQISKTLQALQCRSVVAVLAATKYPISVPQSHTVSVLCLSMGPTPVTLLDQCWLQEVDTYVVEI